MKYYLTYGSNMTHSAGRCAWRFLWDMGSAHGRRGYSGTTGITSKWWPDQGINTAPCSRDTQGSPRGILYPPPSLTWWLTRLFATGSHWWRGRKWDWTALDGWYSGWRHYFKPMMDFYLRPYRPGSKCRWIS